MYSLIFCSHPLQDGWGKRENKIMECLGLEGTLKIEVQLAQNKRAGMKTVGRKISESYLPAWNFILMKWWTVGQHLCKE